MEKNNILLIVLFTIASTDGYFNSIFSKVSNSSRPNIVLIIADDLGWNDVGWKNGEVHTPNLDKLARHGVILENSYMQPLCSPSRAAIFTGKYPYRIGMQYEVVEVNQPKIVPINETLLPELMKKAGYTTHLVGKWHLGQCSVDVIPTSRGFDSFYGLLQAGQNFYTRTTNHGIYDFWENDKIIYPPRGSYNTDLFTDRAVQIINQHKKSSPFFLTLAHTSPHFPLQVPQKYKELYPHITDDKRKTYLGMVSSLDDGVGKVVQALEESGQIDNTVLVFISDNGGDSNFGASNYPLRGNKANLWEGGVKSVGFVYSPKYIPWPGCKHHGLVHAVDWFETILDMAGYNKGKPTDLDSRSQWSNIKKCRGSARKEFIYNIDEITNTAAIRVGNFKLIRGVPEVYAGNVPNITAADPTNNDGYDMDAGAGLIWISSRRNDMGGVPSNDNHKSDRKRPHTINASTGQDMSIRVPEKRGYSKQKDSKYASIENRPNIVLIIADDLGWNDVGWRNREVYTPNMDMLARQGVILENSYVQPLCSPSRTAIFTGKYPYRLGLQYAVIMVNQPNILPTNETLLPQLLKKAGYKTHLVGKWHLGQCSADVLPTARGFDTFYGLLQSGQDFYTRKACTIYDFWEDDKITYPPTGSYNTDLFTERAVQLINNHDKMSPFFLTLAHTSPHFPLQVPQKFKDLYPKIMDDNRKTYLGMVSSLDDSVGKVAKALKQNGEMDNTVIVFLSDNGGDVNYGASNTPLRGNKGSLWEGGMKSVGFLYSPKYKSLSAGCKHRGLIHAVDWYETILDMAGYTEERPKELDSRSQWSYIRKHKGSARNEFIYNIDDVTSTEAIRVGNFKLIKGDPRVFVGVFPSLEHVDPNNRDVRLYNIKVDPYEQNDLAKKRPRTVKRLLKRLLFYRQSGVPAQNQPYLPSNVTSPNGVLQLGWC